MANKTLYIPTQDEGLWEATKRVADQHDTSVYQIVREALDAQLPTIAARPRPADRWAGIAATPEVNGRTSSTTSPTP